MFEVINPATEKKICAYPEHSLKQVEDILTRTQEAFIAWRKTPRSQRVNFILTLAAALRKEETALARLMTMEMGKPILQSHAEVEKCAVACDYYATAADDLLSDESVSLEDTNAIITIEPLGIILGIMPWNFPVWQIFRFAVASLLIGNAVLIKHAPNVTGTGLKLEAIIREAGFPENLFRILLVEPSHLEPIIADPRIAAITLTGSETAGSSVASLAGRYLKKTVLELGGSDPFIVLNDADIAKSVKSAVEARLINNGQSCIAAKRFIIHQDIYHHFLEQLVDAIRHVTVGDPFDEKTQVGPLARLDLLEKLDEQVQQSIALGARPVVGGHRLPQKGYFYAPCILTDLKPCMPAYQEELFGPVFSLFKVSDDAEAIALANQSRYGLGASIWTQDMSKADLLAKQIESGTVAINGKVASDVRLPFGGIKSSGYGRELSHYGIKEFANIKTICIHQHR